MLIFFINASNLESGETIIGSIKAIKKLMLFNNQLLILKQNNTTDSFNNKFDKMDMSNEDKLKLFPLLSPLYVLLAWYLINTMLLEIVR